MNCDALTFGAGAGCQVCGCQAHPVGAERLCFCDSCWDVWWLCCNKEEIVDVTLEETLQLEPAHVAGGESAAAAATAAVSLQAGCDPAPVNPWVDQGGAALADDESALASPPPPKRRSERSLLTLLEMRAFAELLLLEAGSRP